MAGNFKSTRRKQTKVMPSGVEVEMLNLIGAHQALITNSDENRRKNAIDEMLLGCLTRIGNNANITSTHIEILLGQDRAWLLFELRKFSNKRSPNFIFDYEFPVDENGSRRKQRYEVLFNKSDFPQRPYYWVAKKMVENFKEENKINRDLSDTEIAEIYEGEFPKMYDDYSQMLNEHKEQTLILEDSQTTVHWTMLDGKREKEYSKIVSKKNVSSHDQLMQRNPVFEDETSDKIMPALPINDLSQDDIEQLREDIMTKEANIDTTVVVQYREDTRAQVQLNLITLPSFFFPSLAK